MCLLEGVTRGYFADVLARVNTRPLSRFEELLPDRNRSNGYDRRLRRTLTLRPRHHGAKNQHNAQSKSKSLLRDQARKERPKQIRQILFGKLKTHNLLLTFAVPLFLPSLFFSFSPPLQYPLLEQEEAGQHRPDLWIL